MNTDFIMKECPALEVKIFIAGHLADIEAECQAYCSEVGLCVSVKPSTFCYKFGREAGAEITLINYPRFPSENITDKAQELARRLAIKLNQGSYTVQNGTTAYFSSRRDFDK